jgi:hypothetical protein
VLRFLSENANIRRRELLRVFGLSSLMGPLAAVRAQAENPAAVAPGFGRAKSVILVYANGGQSQLET